MSNSIPSSIPPLTRDVLSRFFGEDLRSIIYFESLTSVSQESNENQVISNSAISIGNQALSESLKNSTRIKSNEVLLWLSI